VTPRGHAVRNWGARALEIQRGGVDAVVLENARLRATVLNGLGSEICEFNYKPLDVDFVTVWGERAAAAAGRAGSAPTGLRSFYDAYRGGWQEVMPNGGPPATHAGVEYGQHGEVTRLAWDRAILDDEPDRVRVELRTRLTRAPLELTKTLALDGESPVLEITERLANTGRVPQDVMWGQHIVFGAPFLSERCRIQIEDGARVVPHPAIDGVHPRRLDVEREHRWPLAAAPDGTTIDLSRVPARGEPTEMAYITGLSEGRYAIADERGVGLEVTWDLERFPYLWLWQELGRTSGYPWYGEAYLVGLEPFSSYPSAGLPQAVENGTALRIGAGAEVTAAWTIRVTA